MRRARNQLRLTGKIFQKPVTRLPGAPAGSSTERPNSPGAQAAKDAALSARAWWLNSIVRADHLFGAAAISSDDLGGVDIGVFIIPGKIVFARMPDRAYWSAMTRLN